MDSLKKEKLMVFMLKLTGLWSHTANYFEPSSIYWKFCVLIGGLLVGFFHLGFFVNIYVLKENFKLLVKTTYMYSNTTTSAMKTYLVMIQWTKIHALFCKMDHDYFKPKTRTERQRFEAIMKMQKKISLTLTVGGTITLTLWNLRILIFAWTKELMFTLWYPYDWTASGWYELSHLHQTIVIYHGGFVTLVFDSVLARFMAFIAAQFDLLTYRLKNLNKGPDINCRLVECIQFHRMINSFTGDFINCFHFAFASQFVVTIVSLGFSILALTLVDSDDVMELNTIAMYAGSVFLQLFIYCWFANEITAKSEALCQCMKECTYWIYQSRTFQKNYLTFGMNLQKTMILRPFGLFPVCLDTFTWILRKTWSVFIVVRQIGEV